VLEANKAPAQQQDQPKKLDFISALKATNFSDEPKKTHAQIMREQLGAVAPSASEGHA